MSTDNTMDEAKRMAFSLTQVILKLRNENRQQRVNHMDALKKLASIFKPETHPPPPHQKQFLLFPETRAKKE